MSIIIKMRTVFWSASIISQSIKNRHKIYENRIPCIFVFHKKFVARLLKLSWKKNVIIATYLFHTFLIV